MTTHPIPRGVAGPRPMTADGFDALVDDAAYAVVDLLPPEAGELWRSCDGWSAGLIDVVGRAVASQGHGL